MPNHLTQASKVQSIIFDKSKWSKAEAVAWLNEHEFHSDKIDETENTYRFRQEDPSHFEKFATMSKNLPAGIQYVLGFDDEKSTNQAAPPESAPDVVKQSLPPVACGEPVWDEATLLSQALEVEGKTGREWIVTILKAGPSKDGVHYFRPEVLKQACEKGMFENLPIYEWYFDGRAIGRRDFRHHMSAELEQEYPAHKHVGNLAGVCRQSWFDAASQSVKSKLTFVDDSIATKVKNCIATGADMIGLSIVSKACKQAVSFCGRKLLDIKEFASIAQADLVTFPAGGGTFEQCVAAIPLDQILRNGGSTMKPEIAKRLSAILVAAFGPNEKLGADAEPEIVRQALDGVFSNPPSEPLTVKQSEMLPLLLTLKGQLMSGMVDLAMGTLGELEKLMAQHMLNKASETSTENSNTNQAIKPGKTAAEEADQMKPEELKQSLDAQAEANKATAERLAALEKNLAIERCGTHLETRLVQATGLNEKGKELVRDQYKGREFKPEELDATISKVAAIQGTTLVQGAASTQVGDEAIDKFRKRMELFFGLKPGADEKSRYDGIRAFTSLKQAYIQFTGDELIDGVPNLERVSSDLRQAAMNTGDFATMLDNTMNKVMAREYAILDSNWRELVRIVPADDFNPRQVVRWGGFSDLPEVTETGPTADYADLATPSEEVASYTPTIYGGIIRITRRMLKNDKVGMIQQIPSKLAQRANIKIWRLVTDALIGWNGLAINGATIFDGNPLYDVAGAHSNAVAAALDYDNLLSLRIKMATQTELDSGDVLNVNPGFIVYPPQLMGIIDSLLNSPVLPGGTNAESNVHYKFAKPLRNPYLRSAFNAFLVADAASGGERIEVAFVDGRETPEVILQNAPSVGRTFDADEWAWKVRFEPGVCVSEFRTLAAIGTGLGL